MSDKIKAIQKNLYLDSGEYNPNFVINNEIRKRGIGTGDYKPKLDHTWGDEFYKFEFGKKVGWDFEKTDMLKTVVSKYDRFELVRPKLYGKFCDIVIKNTRITHEMLFDNHIIFDKSDYEKRGLFDIIDNVIKPDTYKPYSYFDPYGGGNIETKEEALELIPKRIVAAINEDSIVADWLFIGDGADLLEEIGSNFFNAKIQ